MSRRLATLTGFGAVLLWALLAVLTVASAPVPPFLLSTLTFAIGGAVGLVWVAATGGLAQLRAVPVQVYVIGSLALFSYHALYFAAFRLADAAGANAETGLIAYLWPLLIVLLSGLLPGERLRPLHIIGALVAFGGAGLIVSAGTRGFHPEALAGYGLAFLCALTWSGYSVLSRRWQAVPTASVAVFCLATAALSLPVHLMLEDTIWPGSGSAWLAILGLGLGPVGLAFFIWDIGVKRGDIQLLGTASYAAPVLSTLALVLVGKSPWSATLALAACLIAGGAILAARAGRVESSQRGA